jgi:hypothetical protein
MATGGMPPGLTKVYFVDYGSGSDGNKGTFDKPFKTLAYAYSKVTTNKNEGIALIGNSTHTLTEMLTVAKNRVHIFGYDPGGRYYGQNAKVSLGVTTAATDLATLKNTGVRNSFRNIKFINENTVAQGIYCVLEAGEYAVYDTCEIYKSTDLDVTGAAEMAMNGDSATVRNCTIGSNANAISGAIIRPCVILTKGLVAGKVSRDVLFENCRFWRWAGDAANAFVWATTATDVERMMEFKDCAFIATIKSTGTPAVALGGAAALTAGEIVVSGSSYEKGCTALATQTGIWSAMPTLAAAGGSSLQCT